MDSETLVAEFGKDPNSVFVDIIRTSPEPIPAQLIKKRLVDAGMKKGDIDRHWKRIQRVIALHPQIGVANRKYEWLAERRSARSSLDLLAGRLDARQPRWLTTAWTRHVADALDRAVPAAGWAEHQFQQARLVAGLAVAVEKLQAAGAPFAEVIELLAEESRRKRLWRVGEPGDTVPFDPEAHEAEPEAPEPGTAVRVVRPGYVWRGSGKQLVAAKATVTL
ncbi:hypothetical protein ACTOB_004325 [Actinoplanes oblitus]|uniref:Nucleotide exchange factor GrpE n=1 Tax=Actinoplanes oblitus TaxID=3040509 RepID=A0ABY8WRR6_9ACTN|nr:hypothetical protein [Actinoplanes oblitus]WIN00610.1 hypothetical protein ACTOB_004325 [Actinoplanes oblitus]